MRSLSIQPVATNGEHWDLLRDNTSSTNSPKREREWCHISVFGWIWPEGLQSLELVLPPGPKRCWLSHWLCVHPSRCIPEKYSAAGSLRKISRVSAEGGWQRGQTQVDDPWWVCRWVAAVPQWVTDPAWGGSLEWGSFSALELGSEERNPVVPTGTPTRQTRWRGKQKVGT